MKTNLVVKHIIDWLKDYAATANINGFVVGISGGIDSAVTSTLCAETGLNVHCLEMPIHQAQSHVNRAQEHIKQLKNRYKNVDDSRVNLSATFDTFSSSVQADLNTKNAELTLANTRARLRMLTLYYYAGLKNYLVAGTGNKVEDFGVGFYTKYGDGGVDISPIADLLKSEVYELGRFLQVPQSIFEAAPSDGLWGDTRSDEDQIGASYPELEWAMQMQNENRKISDFSGRKKTIYDIYLKLNSTNQHKMNPIPVCEIPQRLK